jgi:hypothetical protein
VRALAMARAFAPGMYSTLRCGRMAAMSSQQSVISDQNGNG